MIPALFALMLVAQEPVQSTTSEPAAAEKPEKEKKICRTDPNQTGSRMRKKLCLTQAEWDLRAQGKSAGDLKTMGAR